MKYKNDNGISLSYEDKKDDNSLLIKEVVSEGIRLIEEEGPEKASRFFEENFGIKQD